MVLTPKTLHENTLFEPLSVNIGPAVRPGRRIKKKRQGHWTVQDTTVKKVTKWRAETPTVPIETNICVESNLPDEITCAKFQFEIFRGYDFTEGWISPLIFAWALQQCSATALPVIGLSCHSNSTLTVTVAFVVRLLQLHCIATWSRPFRQPFSAVIMAPASRTHDASNFNTFGQCTAELLMTE